MAYQSLGGVEAIAAARHPGPARVTALPQLAAKNVILGLVASGYQCPISHCPLGTSMSIAVAPCGHAIDMASILDNPDVQANATVQQLAGGDPAQCPLCRGSLHHR